MPKLPDAAALGERPVPVLVRRDLRTIDSGARAEAAGERAAQAFFQAGAHLGKMAGDFLKAKEEADTLAAESAYNRLKQKQLDLTHGEKGFLTLRGADAVNRDVPVEYGKQLAEASGEISAGLSNDYQRQLFSKRAANSQLQLQEQAFAHVARQADVYANEVLQGTLETESRLAAAGGDAATSLVRMDAAIDRHALRFGLPEEAVTAAKMKAANSVHLGVIDRLLATGQDEEASTYYERTRNSISPDVSTKIEGAFARYRERRESEAKTALTAINEAATSDLEIAVRRGQAGFRDIENAYDSRIITPQKRVQLTEIIDSEQRAAAERARKREEQLLFVRGLIDGQAGAYADPKNVDHRKAVNETFKVTAAGRDSAGQQQLALRLGQTTGILPDAFKGQIRGALRAGDAAAVAAASAQVVQIRNVSPQLLLDNFEQKDIELAIDINGLISAGVAPNVAVTSAVERQRASPAEVAGREARYTSERAKAGNVKYLDDALVGDVQVYRDAAKFATRIGLDVVRQVPVIRGLRLLARDTKFFVGKDPAPSVFEVPPEMQAHFETLVSDAYMRGGDLEAARASALAVLAANWGVTTANRRAGNNSEPRWMYKAPEKEYYVAGAEPEWVRVQLLDRIRQLPDEKREGEHWLEPHPRIDEQSRPRYLLKQRKPDGIIITLTDAYQPDYQAFVERQDALMREAPISPQVRKYAKVRTALEERRAAKKGKQ